MRIKKGFAVLAAMLCLLLSGCLLQSAEELYALPKQPEEYYTLQNQLDRILQAGGSYCAPVAGDCRQAVQLADLDSDGQEEALAFFKLPGEKPLRVYIFKKTEAGYAQTACIEGDGSAFESVSYCQLDTALGLEIVLGRQVSDQVPQALCVYTLAGDQVTELLNVSCVRHTLADLDGNGLQELLTFHIDDDTAVGRTDYYRWQSGAMALAGSADMTAPLTADSIRRIVCGQMQAQVPAVFVANTYEPENATIVSDVFILDCDEFCNVSKRGDSAEAAVSARYQRVYAVDIDADGLIELPEPVQLPGLTQSDVYYKIQWYNLQRDGTRQYKKSTFHNYPDGWYLDLRTDWEEKLAVAAIPDAQGYGFYCADDGAQRFAIYAFTGSDAQAQAEADGRFVLAEKGDTVYAGEIFDPTVTQAQLQAAFHFIIIHWNSGEV